MIPSSVKWRRIKIEGEYYERIGDKTITLGVRTLLVDIQWVLRGRTSTPAKPLLDAILSVTYKSPLCCIIYVINRAFM